MKTTIKTMLMSFPGEKCGVLFVATTSTGMIVGTVVLKDYIAGEAAEFSRLFVHERVRRHGVGRALLAAVHSMAKNGRASGICGYVNHTNADALAFYKREQFMPIYRFGDGDHLVWRPIT